MNSFIQKALVATVFIVAVGFLVSKYFITKKPKNNKKDCGNGSCGC